ncbi:MAG TPA: exo-beta-N-acetylmuramidase NamZ domain-containing protein [Candidatus Limnocylindrales bacterium]|nr:exo-beta-N-acetylmuramidase NamZ domain-containing protein [Candidatus Limnocylindrales bacterium]
MKCFGLLRTTVMPPAVVAIVISQYVGAATFAEPAAEAEFRAEKLKAMDAAILQTIADKGCPGGVLWLEHHGMSYHKAYGNRAVVPANELMTEDTIFDLASLTKVVACTPAVMLLIERGELDLDAPVSKYIPEFSAQGKEDITVKQLMVHLSGLRGDIETQSDWHGREVAIQKACQEKLVTSPGTAFRYSDINFFLLGEIVQRLSKTPLEEFVAHEIYQPLKMVDTSYLPPNSKLDRIAPTEVVNGKPWRGIVHDPTARHMGGVAGHAGLFSTAADLARYARMLLNGGELDGVRIFKPETVVLMTRVQTPETVRSRRGLGWDIDSGYSGLRGNLFPLGSYGHTGWTGTSIWIDPFSQSFIIFLSNRNHPDESGSVGALRAELGTLAAEAIPDFNFAYVPGALSPVKETDNSARAIRKTVQLNTREGIDVLKQQHFGALKGLRVGLITNHTGHDRQRNSTIDLLKQAPGVQLLALFSPEHGIRGAMDEPVGDTTDEKTGLPVYSLYGASLKPKPQQLTNLDALVFDIQDVGCRFYTYTATMALAMEAAAESQKKYFVLDRVNPINGTAVEGPVLQGDPTFVAFHAVPLRYGMTIGELARMFKSERHCDVDLTVIPLENWRRDVWFDQTGLPWSNPSPNIRNLTEATLYPGIGLLETALSVGRGTDTPFELIGAPYIDELKLAEELNNTGLPGVRFVPVQFTPTYSVHKSELCHGVYIMLVDRDSCNVVDVALQIAKILYRLYPEHFQPEKLERLLRHPPTLAAIKADKSLEEIRATWKEDVDRFGKCRARYLLY